MDQVGLAVVATKGAKIENRDVAAVPPALGNFSCWEGTDDSLRCYSSALISCGHLHSRLGHKCKNLRTSLRSNAQSGQGTLGGCLQGTVTKFRITKFLRNKGYTLQNFYVTFFIRHKIYTKHNKIYV
jgi:hypothetical protein